MDFTLLILGIVLGGAAVLVTLYLLKRGKI